MKFGAIRAVIAALVLAAAAVAAERAGPSEPFENAHRPARVAQTEASPFADPDLLHLAHVDVGARSREAEAILVAQGYAPGRPPAPRLETPPFSEGESLFWRRRPDLVELVALDHAGGHVAGVRWTVLSGAPGSGGRDGLGWADDETIRVKAALVRQLGLPDGGGEGDTDLWWMCCRAESYRWRDAGVALDVRSGFGVRSLRLGWRSGDLLAAVGSAGDARPTDPAPGIDRLLASGAAAPARRSDFVAWLEAYLDRAAPRVLRTIRPRADALVEAVGLAGPLGGDLSGAYVLRREVPRLPEAAPGRAGYLFVVPADVRPPGGDWGRNRVYLVAGGRCRTGAGVCPAQAALGD